MNRSHISNSMWPFASLLVILALVFSACAPAATPAEAPPYTQAVEQPQPTEIPIQPTELPKQSEQQATLTMWVSLESNEFDLLVSELNDFQAANPGIQVQAENIPFGDLESKLFTSLAAGVPPDVVALTYNTIARLVDQGVLAPPDFSLLTNRDDFIPDSLQSNFFNDILYALPWHRQACAPDYLSLALPKYSSSRIDLSTRLIDYLSAKEIQANNYKVLGWYPTRQSVYDDQSLACPPVQAIRLEPKFVESTISLVKEREPLIQRYLGDLQVNYEAASAWLQDGETRVASVPLKFPVPEQQVQDQFYAKGMPIGGLFVNSSPEIKPGNYAVICRADGDWAICDLTDENGEITAVKPVDFARTQSPVGQQFVLLEQGSFRQCWYLDGLKICINIG